MGIGDRRLIELAKKTLTDLENILKTYNQADCPITDHFSEGLYLRERFAKANTLIVGKRHRQETMSILLKGILCVYTDDEKVKEIHAPCIWATKAGTKRMTYSKTDTILVTVHPTEETDLKKIEKEVIIPEKEYLENRGDIKCLG